MPDTPKKKSTWDIVSEMGEESYNPADGVVVLDDQGGGVMSVEIDKVGALLACAARAHEPIVLERKKNMDEPVGVDCYNMALTKDKAMTVCEPRQATRTTSLVSLTMRVAGTTRPQYLKPKKPTSFCIAGNVVDRNASTLKSVGPTLNTMHEPQQVLSKNQLRRLTPLECTRLQGFDDGWVDIGDWTDTKGKVHKESDSVKYKALGNSIALPFWQFLADRMVAVLKRDGVENPKMCSLFSGIGGFEVVFSRAGCEPTWNSEIEEFPIAVTKKHFGDDDTGLKGDWSHLCKKPNYVTGGDVPPAQS